VPVRRGRVTAALAGCLLAGAAAASPPADTARAAPGAGKPEPPDESLLEFLGQDDVDDAKWWEFFRHTSAHGRDADDDPPPSEDEKQ
jgi:hypothetical protein